jgi:hypothetical protein
MDERSKQGPGAERFARSSEERNPGLVRELWQLIKEERKWWMVPVVVVLLVIGVLIVLGSTAAAPFIYSLF